MCLIRAALCAVALIGATSASADEPGNTRIPTVTRLVQMFLDREEALQAATQAADRAKVAALITDDFELRAGPRPGTPVARETWLAQAPGPGFSIEQMAVHEHGGTAVVSFLGHRASGGDLFFVDVWTHNDADWCLSTRYVAPAGDTATALPGWTQPNDEVIDKRY
jgi:hypothetical protein